MIKTIKSVNPEAFDELVNAFIDSQWDASKGISKVFATQTHYARATQEGEYDHYVAVIFYREAHP